MAALIVVNPGVQFKAVEGNSLSTNAYFGEVWPDLGVEAVSVHAQVARGVPEAEQPGIESDGGPYGAFHDGSPFYRPR